MCVIGRKSKRAQPRLHGITPGLHDSYTSNTLCSVHFAGKQARRDREREREGGRGRGKREREGGGTKRIENNCSTSDSIVPSYAFRARFRTLLLVFHPFVCSSTRNETVQFSN